MIEDWHTQKLECEGRGCSARAEYAGQSELQCEEQSAADGWTLDVVRDSLTLLCPACSKVQSDLAPDQRT
jgi:hypothetical protein